MPTKNMNDLLVDEINAEIGRQRKKGSQLENILHISQRAINYRLNSERTLKWEEAYEIAQWLGLSLTELVSRAEQVKASYEMAEAG